MAKFNVTLKENAPEEEYQKAKQAVIDQGGKIDHEFKLIKGFTAEIPDDTVSTLKSNPHVDVEADGVVKTQ